jgi:hypothetical protein
MPSQIRNPRSEIAKVVGMGGSGFFQASKVHIEGATPKAADSFPSNGKIKLKTAKGYKSQSA